MALGRSDSGCAFNPAIQVLWAEFGAACDYPPLAKLAEAQQMFTEFDRVEL